MGKYEIEYISSNYNYVYMVNGAELELTTKLTVNELNVVVLKVEKILYGDDLYNKNSLDINFKDFISIALIIFSKELGEYLIQSIKNMILNCDIKKVTEASILRYIFNATDLEISYTIHSSKDNTISQYSEKVKFLLTSKIDETKSLLIGELVTGKYLNIIKSKLKIIGYNLFLEVCGKEYLKESIAYFEYIIEEYMIKDSMHLSLNSVLAMGTGLSKKDAKDFKNKDKSVHKNNLYKEIQILIDKYNQGFYLLKSEEKLIGYIEKNLDSKNKLNVGEVSCIRASRILNICLVKYPEKLVTYLKFVISKLVNEGTDITRQNVLISIFEGVDKVSANHIYTYYKMNNENSIIEDLICQEYKNSLKLHDKVKITLDDDIWYLHWRIKETSRKITINFSSVENSIIKNQLKQYYKYMIEQEYKHKTDKTSIPSVLRDSHLAIESIRYLQKQFHINSVLDIRRVHVYRLMKYLQNEYKTSFGKNISISTIESCNSRLKGFVDWLIENDIKGIEKPKVNFFRYVRFKGGKGKKTEIIPECVIDGILTHIDELRDDYQRLILILMNTGMRFKEVSYLEEDCLDESTEDTVILKYIPYKVLEARRKAGLDDYHRIVIDDELREEIETQISYTSQLRKKYNTKEIFIYLGKYQNLSLIDNSVLCSTMQGLIERNNITDESGQIWKITTKQYRKTLAVDMITSGDASIYEVGSYLNHMNIKTTEKIYAEVRKRKLKELDNEFFREKFELLLEKQKLENFSEKERKLLYVDFCLNSRDVEFGVCMKKFSTEICERRGNRFPCAGCSKICIGKQHFKRWKKLYEEQEVLVNALISKYEEENISKDIYEKFREFEKESDLLRSSKEVLDKLKGAFKDVE